MSDAIERWCELADADAAGEALTAEEQAFLREHAALAEHAQEQALFADIEQLGEPGPVLSEDRRRAADTLTRFRESEVPSTGPRWGRAGLAVVLAAAAAVLVWVVVEPQLAEHRDASGSNTLADAQVKGDEETFTAPSATPAVAPVRVEDPQPIDVPEVEPVVVPPSANPSRKPVVREDRSKSASQMLAEARALANAGALGRAVAAYDALRRAHPESADANAANVSIGELQLRRGRAREALRAFDRYLGRGGALAEEARWGRVRALSSLGNTAARDRAIDQLLAAHPHTVYAREAKAMRAR